MTFPSRTDPLLALVHVPKTAGSTINQALTTAFPKGKDHCEAFIDVPETLRAFTKQADWVSGHVNFSLMSARLSKATQRPVKYFTTVRNPTKQVISHYNWLIEIYHRGPRVYSAHPPHIRALSKKIRETDNTDPEAIASVLRDHAGLFLNTQSRTILGTGFNWNGGRVMRRLSQYEFIATERDIDQMIELMTGQKQEAQTRKNVSRYHFDRKVFDHARLRNFLLRQNFLDWALYSAVEDSRVRVAATPKFRRQRRHTGPKAIPNVTLREAYLNFS